jgi:uncharacterized integral membrane protein
MTTPQTTDRATTDRATTDRATAAGRAEEREYAGQFGPFVIGPRDRHEVRLYRGGLAIAALAWMAGVGLVLLSPHPLAGGIVRSLSWLYGVMVLGLGLSLWTIHIYLRPLHRLLQAFWGVGMLASVAIAARDPAPLIATVYHHPASLWGVGFVFAALTGIFFKEAFCFNRLETKVLVAVVPTVLLGHLTGWLPAAIAQPLLALWAGLFGIFVLRKLAQPLDPDVGDKSVFAYLANQQAQETS